MAKKKDGGENYCIRCKLSYRQITFEGKKNFPHDSVVYIVLYPSCQCGQSGQSAGCLFFLTICEQRDSTTNIL